MNWPISPWPVLNVDGETNLAPEDAAEDINRTEEYLAQTKGDS